MLNIEQYLFKHFHQVWKNLIETLYNNDVCFAKSIPKEAILENNPFNNSEFEQIKSYLHEIARETFQNCNIT